MAAAGYKIPYGGKSITVVARVKAGHEGGFPVRNLEMENIESTKVGKGSLALYGIRCSLYKTGGGEKNGNLT